MNFIPIESYNSIYHYFILIIVIIVFFKSFGSKLNSSSNLNSANLLGLFLYFSIVLYMGLRPISGQFGDMGNYAKRFFEFQNGELPIFEKDVLFEYIMYLFAKISNTDFFFFFCAFIYTYPLYLFSKKVFKEYWFYSFLILVASLSFWSYGTNGIRNGIATSIFLFAMCTNNNVFKILLIVISVFIHQSMIIPCSAYVITLFFNNNKIYFIVWLLAIPISVILGNALENFFLDIGFAPKVDIEGYLGQFDEDSEGVVLKVGFRWDFLIYSASAVFAAWFYVFKKKYNDIFYVRLVNIYLISNSFWILIIRANYSNRFAYLSWFMMAIIIIYPLLKVKFYKNQHQVIGFVILCYCFLSFILNVILVSK